MLNSAMAQKLHLNQKVSNGLWHFISSNISNERQKPLQMFYWPPHYTCWIQVFWLHPPYVSICDTVLVHGSKSICCNKVINPAAPVIRFLSAVKKDSSEEWCPFLVCLFSGHFKGLRDENRGAENKSCPGCGTWAPVDTFFFITLSKCMLYITLCLTWNSNMSLHKGGVNALHFKVDIQRQSAGSKLIPLGHEVRLLQAPPESRKYIKPWNWLENLHFLQAP